MIDNGAEGSGSPRPPLLIAILSFNRPQYLEQTLASLKIQLHAGDEVVLFQDGGFNEKSGRHKASDADVAACVRTFHQIIDTGTAFVSPLNLGICGNYRQAETFVFKARNAPFAVFLEDDMILSPYYLDVMGDLLDLATQHANIGYVSAYGDLWAPLEVQEKNEGLLRPMHENWGSGLTQAAWVKQMPVREHYWQLVKDCDYSCRDGGAIAAFYAKLGYPLNFTSQDAARWVACAEAKLARITTATCQARYIGERGEHFSPAHYNTHRFGESVFYPRRPRLAVPDDSVIAAFIAAERQNLLAGYQHAYIGSVRGRIG